MCHYIYVYFCYIGNLNGVTLACKCLYVFFLFVLHIFADNLFSFERCVDRDFFFPPKIEINMSVVIVAIHVNNLWSDHVRM